MSERTQLLIGLYLAMVALLVGSLLYMRRSGARARQLCSVAARAIDATQYQEALDALLAAESAWVLLIPTSGATRDLTTLDDYEVILRLLSRLPATAGDAECLAQLGQAITDLRALFTDRANFGFDGQRMQPDARVRWSDLCSRLHMLREQFRCRHRPSQGAA